MCRPPHTALGFLHVTYILRQVHAHMPLPSSNLLLLCWQKLRLALPLHLASCYLQVLVKQESGWCPDPYCDGCYLLSLATEGAQTESGMAPGWPKANTCNAGRWRSACVDRFRLRLGLELEPRALDQGTIMFTESWARTLNPWPHELLLQPSVPTNLFGG